MTRDREAAEDLLQETFIRLITETRAGRPPEQVRAWLYRVAANAAISRGRHGSVWNRLVPRLLDRREPASPESEALRVERDSELHTALATPRARCASRPAAGRARLQRPGDRRLHRSHRGRHAHAPLPFACAASPRPRSGGGCRHERHASRRPPRPSARAGCHGPRLRPDGRAVGRARCPSGRLPELRPAGGRPARRCPGPRAGR